MKRLKSLNKAIKDEQQGPSQSSSSKLTKLTSPTKNIKEFLYVYGDELHKRYKEGEILTCDELKAMKCGLSCIRDLAETKENAKRNIFNDEVLMNLMNDNKKLIMKIPKLDQVLEEKWNTITTFIKAEVYKVLFF